MIIYKCIISGDEMFSDIYKITESKDGLFFIVEGHQISRTDKIDDSLIGGNASAEDCGEGNDDVTVSGVDIVLNHKLVETGFQKKDFQIYLKTYLGAVKEKIAKDEPERVTPFQNAACVAVKEVMKNFKNYQFFTGESMNPDGTVGLLDYKDDNTPFMMFFKDGLEIEKC